MENRQDSGSRGLNLATPDVGQASPALVLRGWCTANSRYFRPPNTSDTKISRTETINLQDFGPRGRGCSRQNGKTSITRAYRVPDDFHARFQALSRTYVYRIALGVSYPSQLPLAERDMCWNLRHTELDVEAMSEAGAMLLGTHDFSSFRAVNSDLSFRNPVRTLDVARIQPGRAFVCEHFHREIPFWELTFKSKSFLYKQVRRMTGALVAVGQRRISLTKLKEIMEARDSLAYPKNIIAPARGLFLTRVDYSESDLLSPQTSAGVRSNAKIQM
ncbi:tRNA pseudouridine synthase-like 1 isoform X5 [Vanacampus margaritifer]